MNDDDTGLTARRVALYAVLTAMLAFYLVPLESGLTTSVKSLTAVQTTSPFVPPLPGQFTASPWGEAWAALQDGLVNSLLMAVPATVLSALLGSMTAYGLTKVDWKGQLAVVTLFLAGVFIPYQAVLVPLVTFWTDVGLSELLGGVPFLGDKVGLIQLSITHVAYGLPICTILFRGYYQTIDDDILEAARLDGASVAGIYRQIILPLSVPMFAVVLIYQFTNIWNDLLFGLVLVTSENNQIVTVALNGLQGSMTQQFNLQMAGAFIAALPTLLVYVLFGEQFADGVAGRT
jgi:glucose/mannose transport system permease protein